ncbi:MAG: hypothetical protein KA140_07985, partial [Caldisericia bacterium]|nr:hypothetical protein [Caldisericia bacterium]
MKRTLTILLVLSMVFGSIFGLVGEVKAQPTVTPTVTPNSVNQIAAFTFKWTQAIANVDEFRVIFPSTFDLSAAVVNSTTCMISYYTSDVTRSTNTIIFHYPTTISIPVQSEVTITISKDAKIRNPATCGTLARPINVTRDLHAPNPASSTTEAHFVYYVESTVTFAATDGVVVDPPIVDTAAQLTLTATLGGCGALGVGDTINIELPSSYGSYSFTAPDKDCVTIEYGTTIATLGAPIHPSTVTKETYPLNILKLEVPFGTSIPAGNIVRVTFSRTCNLKTPTTANYYYFGFGTSREKFSVQSTRVMIANHLKVTVLGNTVSSVNPEYKLEWTLHSGATLSGNNGDWIEVNFYYPTNPAPDNASITNDFTIPAQVPPASSILLTNTYGWSWGGTSYYASSVVALGPKSLRINLPSGFTVSAGGTITITFLASAGLINTTAAGTYKLQARHSNAQEWIPSDGYSILDGVIFNATPSVYVNPPTVSQEAGYTVVFSTGQRLRTGDTITIAFPSGTSLKNWNSSLAAGSIYLFSGPPTAFGADIIFDPNIDCPPVINPSLTYTAPLIG